MGFCFFSNVAVAAKYVRTPRRVKRVAIIDFDVHFMATAPKTSWPVTSAS